MKGLLTFEAEGVSDPKSRYYSRVVHVPSAWSGVTIGRGYDLKHRSEESVFGTLRGIGCDYEMAYEISLSAGLKGDEAKNYILENDLKDYELTAEQEIALFEISYKEILDDVRRICNKKATIKAYGFLDIDKCHELYRDIIVDLRFRGDYIPRTRRIIQRLAVKNKKSKFIEAMANRENWENVPRDRFERRKRYAAMYL